MEKVLIYKILSIKDINDDITKKYLSMLSDVRKNKLLEMKDKLRAAQLFAGEILARQCLSELCDAPEFAFNLLINPDSKSVVSNFSANISLSVAGEYVACAASYDFVGINISEPAPFSFSQAQKMLSDAEIRYLYSLSKDSFVNNISKESCDEDDVIKAFAQLVSLKYACYQASGRGIPSAVTKFTFDLSHNVVKCLDEDYSVLASLFLSDKGIACSVVERRKI